MQIRSSPVATTQLSSLHLFRPQFFISPRNLKFPFSPHHPLIISKSHFPKCPLNHSVATRFSLVPEGESSDLETRRDCFFTVSEFMIKKEDMRVVKPTTTIVEAMEMLVEYKINGFPVIDDDWKLIGVVSDYDLLALGTASFGSWLGDTSMFPEVDSPWKKFKELRKLQSMSEYKVIGDLMTKSPLLVVKESTCLEDAASLLLRTKHRRLPVVDFEGKLVGMLTRGNVVKAGLVMSRMNKIK